MNTLKNYFALGAFHVQHAFVAKHARAININDCAQKVLQLGWAEGFVRTEYKAFHIVIMGMVMAWPGSVVGTRLDATVGYRDAAYARPSLILMGNEQAGLTDALAAACDVNVKIPMRGRADSLNLAIATGVMVYAVTD